MKSIDRRTFLRTSSLAALGLALSPRAARCALPTARPLFTAMGVAADAGRAAELKACGAHYLVDGVSRLLAPDQPDAVFEERRAQAAGAALPIRGCNGFIRPAHLKCTGPQANHDAVLAWADTTFRRARRAGVEWIIFGSAGARRLPEGWPEERADEQFVSLLRAIGPLAAAQDVLVLVEPLQQRECNYLMYLRDVARVVAAAGHPSIRALADLYHMSSMEEGPESILASGPHIACVEIAEKNGRTAPGVAGQDFRPYFAALREVGYSGPITIEGRWDTEQLSAGFREIARQAG